MFGAVFPAPSCAHFSPREENPSSPRGGHLSEVFFGCWWWLGVPAGLTEPLSGHGALLRGAGGDRACLTGWVVVRYARNSCGVIYFTVCKLYTYETYHSMP